MLRVALLLGGVALLVIPTAGAQPAGSERDQRAGIGVVQVEGVLDPPTVTLLLDAIADANEQDLTMLLVQIDSPGAVSGVDGVLRAIERSRVPVVTWVGPSGGEASGGATLVVEAAHAAFMAQGSDLGPGDPVRADEPDAVSVGETRETLARLAAQRARPGGCGSARHELGRPREQLGIADGVRPTIGEVIVTLDGTSLETAAG